MECRRSRDYNYSNLKTATALYSHRQAHQLQQNIRVFGVTLGVFYWNEDHTGKMRRKQVNKGCETVSSQVDAPTGWMLVEIVKFSFTSVTEPPPPTPTPPKKPVG
ncbi:hypothetical protein PO909_002016 [Leuciscus waleckii]